MSPTLLHGTSTGGSLVVCAFATARSETPTAAQATNTADVMRTLFRTTE